MVDFKSHTSFGSQTPAVEMNGNDNGCLFPGIIDSMGVPVSDYHLSFNKDVNTLLAQRSLVMNARRSILI